MSGGKVRHPTQLIFGIFLFYHWTIEICDSWRVHHIILNLPSKAYIKCNINHYINTELKRLSPLFKKKDLYEIKVSTNLNQYIQPFFLTHSTNNK